MGMCNVSRAGVKLYVLLKCDMFKSGTSFKCSFSYLLLNELYQLNTVMSKGGSRKYSLSFFLICFVRF